MHMEPDFFNAAAPLRFRRRLSCTLVLMSIVLMQKSYSVAEIQSGRWLGRTGDSGGDRQQYLRSYYGSTSPDYSQGWCPYNVVNVDWYGAKGDGQTDDAQAFADAWSNACSLDSAVLLIPEEKTYLVSPLSFKGPCGNSLTVELAGTLVAPPDPPTWNKSNSNAWLHFSHLNDLTVEGGGTIDGQGQKWWAKSCKVNKTNKCHDAPTALKLTEINNLIVRTLKSVNSPQIHITFEHCYGVQAVGLQVVAPAHSPNTDGIHISGSQNVLIQDCSVGTGDDCVSIVSGSSDIRVKNMTCGPGHGISIGSLGKGRSEASVSLVVVDGAVLTGTSNGLRIKTWQGGSGSAIGFVFQNVQVNNVSYPIIIDQNYCDSPSPCPVNQTSAVQVSQVIYRNISGTSATLEAVKLACSDAAPCKNLLLQDINLTLARGGNSTSRCNSAEGVYMEGTVIPPVDCLQPSGSKSHSYCTL